MDFDSPGMDFDNSEMDFDNHGIDFDSPGMSFDSHGIDFDYSGIDCDKSGFERENKGQRQEGWREYDQFITKPVRIISIKKPLSSLFFSINIGSIRSSISLLSFQRIGAYEKKS
jgi:hypothetical protein